MGMFVKTTSQCVLLLSFVLVACLATPALSGRSMDSMKSEMKAGANSAGMEVTDSFTCTRHENSTSSAVVFCCYRLGICLPSLKECNHYCCGNGCPQTLKDLDQ
ncbi:hypothetical protein ACP4OV_018387 [Aristida adscensionis]